MNILVFIEIPSSGSFGPLGLPSSGLFSAIEYFKRNLRLNPALIYVSPYNGMNDVGLSFLSFKNLFNNELLLNNCFKDMAMIILVYQFIP